MVYIIITVRTDNNFTFYIGSHLAGVTHIHVGCTATLLLLGPLDEVGHLGPDPGVGPLHPGPGPALLTGLQGVSLVVSVSAHHQSGNIAATAAAPLTVI